jgi:hypothetical protein
MPDFSKCPECVETYDDLIRVVRVSANLCRDLDNSNVDYGVSEDYPDRYEITLDCGSERKVKAVCRVHRVTKTVDGWDCPK